MVYLLLNILCSTSIALILKYSDTKKDEPIVLLAGNYFIASIIATVLLFTKDEIIFTSETFLFGLGLGLMFVIVFFVFAKAIAYAGTGLATTSSRLSVIIPVLLSILIQNELPTEYHLFGFVFTIITFVLFYFSVKGNNNAKQGITKYLFLLAAFIGIGLNDYAMKVFQSWRSPNEEPFFVLFIFSFAFIYSIIFIRFKKIKIERKTFGNGVLLGVPNVFSTVFLLAALSELPAIFVYPIVNVGIILFTVIFAFILFKEKLNVWGFAALASGIIAILFLSLGN